MHGKISPPSSATRSAAVDDFYFLFARKGLRVLLPFFAQLQARRADRRGTRGFMDEQGDRTKVNGPFLCLNACEAFLQAAND
jgi:hypothetical protein